MQQAALLFRLFLNYVGNPIFTVRLYVLERLYLWLEDLWKYLNVVHV